jgi:hypothetical protein
MSDRDIVAARKSIVKMSVAVTLYGRTGIVVIPEGCIQKIIKLIEDNSEGGIVKLVEISSYSPRELDLCMSAGGGGAVN